MDFTRLVFRSPIYRQTIVAKGTRKKSYKKSMCMTCLMVSFVAPGIKKNILFSKNK